MCDEEFAFSALMIGLQELHINGFNWNLEHRSKTGV